MAYKLFKILRGRFGADIVSCSVIVNGFCLLITSKSLEVLKEMAERWVESNAVTYNIMLFF